jgi:hypothetical protein
MLDKAEVKKERAVFEADMAKREKDRVTGQLRDRERELMDVRGERDRYEGKCDELTA